MEALGYLNHTVDPKYHTPGSMAHRIAITQTIPWQLSKILDLLLELDDKEIMEAEKRIREIRG